MQDRNYFTLIVAHGSGARVSKYRVPRYLPRFILTSLLLLIASAVALIFYFGNTVDQLKDKRQVQAESTRLKKENESLRASTMQVGEKLAALEITSKKLQLMSGMDRDDSGFGGVGGVAARDLTRSSAAELLGKINGLDRRATEVESQFQELKNLYSRQNDVLAYTPSLMPVRGYLSGGYGYRADPFTRSRDFHSGVDISAPYGNKVVVPADGVVIFAGYRHDYGNIVVINHKFGFTTRYGHLSRMTVVRGQRVQREEVLGYVGSTGRSTGPHLHYEVRFNDRPVNPHKFLTGRRG